MLRFGALLALISAAYAQSAIQGSLDTYCRGTRVGDTVSDALPHRPSLVVMLHRFACFGADDAITTLPVDRCGVHSLPLGHCTKQRGRFLCRLCLLSCAFALFTSTRRSSVLCLSSSAPFPDVPSHTHIHTYTCAHIQYLVTVFWYTLLTACASMFNPPFDGTTNCHVQLYVARYIALTSTPANSPKAWRCGECPCPHANPSCA